MEHVINLEDKIVKTVGRRGVPSPLRTNVGDIANAKAWRRVFPRLRGMRPGVYKFKSHEEADAWLMTHLTRKNPS